MSDLPFDDSISALSQFFVGSASMHDTLTKVVDVAAAAIPAARYVGITMLEGGRARTSVFSDPELPEIDQAQYSAGTGPCLDAFRNGEIYRITDTRDDGPWPEFRKSCEQHGIRSTMSMPLVVQDISYGALNLYSEQVDAFGALEIEAVQSFTVPASVVLANARAYWDERRLREQLSTAMTSRAEIEQAKGILMGTIGCTPDQAFERLVAQSQHENRKLRDVAIEIVENASKRRQ